MQWFTEDYTSIEESDIYHLVSNTNIIKNLTAERLCTTKQLKFLINLCSRLEHLNFSVDWKDFESIAGLLLSKKEGRPRNLFSLCITNENKLFSNQLVIWIKSKQWLDDYSIELIGLNHIYLGW